MMFVVLPLAVKLFGLGFILWQALKKPEPAKAAVIADPPQPAPPPECAGPELGARWSICSSGPYAVRGTDSWGDYDALYAVTDQRLVAVVDNRTYDDDGNSALVVGLPGTDQIKSTVAVPDFPLVFRGG